MLSNSEPDDSEAFVSDAILLLETAEQFDATPAFRTIVENRLLRSDQALWRHISKNAELWADISTRLHSPIIFREAMSHLVGRVGFTGDFAIDTELLLERPNGEMLLDLAHAKAKELQDKKLTIEKHLSEYFPPEMLHSDTSAKETYADNIYLWQALTLVRQYITSSYHSNKHHLGEDGGAAFYRAIGRGGNAYLRRSALHSFCKSISMSDEGEVKMKNAVDSIKEKLKPIVAPLLVSHLELEEVSELKYLTCTEIVDQELPWMVELEHSTCTEIIDEDLP